MGTQIYFEDIAEGADLPPVTRTAGTAQLFLFSAVTRNPHRIHYDLPYAKKEEHRDVLVHGPLHGAMLCSFVTNWMGDEGTLKRFGYQNRGRAVQSEPLTFKGRVTKKYENDGGAMVDLEVWEENEEGEVTVPGSAVVALPKRG